MGVDDERAVQAQRLLAIGLGVRVIEERPGLGHRELVGEARAGRDRRLRDAGRPVHAVRNDEPMPVHAGWIGEGIANNEANAIALRDPDPRTGHLTVEGVRRNLDAGQDVPARDRGLERIDLDRSIQPRLERLIAAGTCRGREAHGAGIHR